MQHELGIFLRSSLGTKYKVQFERSVSFFDLEKNNFAKKEIDISIFLKDLSIKHAIEIKFPRNGQYPEQMFKACKDIYFLEQLIEAKFDDCYFIMIVDDPLFYRGEKKDGIYEYFRGNKPLHGQIWKPTGLRDENFYVNGKHNINWIAISKSLRYFANILSKK